MSDALFAHKPIGGIRREIIILLLFLDRWATDNIAHYLHKFLFYTVVKWLVESSNSKKGYAKN